MVIDAEKKKSIAEEIDRVLFPDGREVPTGITVKEYAAIHDITESVARNFLTKAKDAGELVGRKVLLNRSWTWVFWVPEEEKDEEAADSLGIVSSIRDTG